jgi:hypothetical protein
VLCFFINGMLSALLHHKADSVLVSTLFIAFDISSVSMFIAIITALFSRSSIRRYNAVGIIVPGSRIMRQLSRLFRRPFFFGLLLGIAVTIIIFILAKLFLTLLGIQELSFAVYMILKTVFCALLGAAVSFICLYAGMSDGGQRTEDT